ncbi:MAG TPA: alkaline phosphatase family protein, partial [Actinomycetota bacterium]|nr:alkaline phosphatase family protein [Actinomycetota bacterium]
MRLWPALLALAFVASACTSSGVESGTPSAASPAGSVPPSAPPPPISNLAMAQRVCAAVSHEVLLRTWRGYFPGRGGDVQIIPTYPNFVNGGLTHATPYAYTQEVPLFLYGPGYVRPGVYPRRATLADIAPTAGALLKFPFHAPDGTAQQQALLPADQRPLPKLLVTMVWDSAGWDVLDRWKDDWPYLRSLLPEGALFTDVTVGSSPSNTPTGHSIIGTGAFPRRTGFVDEYIRVNGRIQKPNAEGPAFLLQPTLADLYDRAMGNRPIVGGIASLSAHITMMGHGSLWGGADRDLAVTREAQFGPTGGAESDVWNLTDAMAPFYTFPGYVNSLPPVTAYTRSLDQADGQLDDAWRGHPFTRLHNGFDTPARSPYQEALIETMVQREGFGRDDVPDLLDLNYKAIDTIGHLFSADGVEMS